MLEGMGRINSKLVEEEIAFEYFFPEASRKVFDQIFSKLEKGPFWKERTLQKALSFLCLKGQESKPPGPLSWPV